MEEEIDFDLDLTEWETLKALGAPEPDYRRLNQRAVQQLAAKELATMLDDYPIITPMGRKVVVRARPSYGTGRREPARSIPGANLRANDATTGSGVEQRTNLI